MDQSWSSPGKVPRRVSWLVGETGWALLAIIIACLMLVVAVWQVRQSAEWQADRTASRLAEAIAQDTERDLEQLDLILQTVMAGDQTPASRSLTPGGRNALLFERTPRDRYIDFVNVLDQDGSVLATLRPDDPPNNWGNQDYFEALRTSTTNGLFVGRPFKLAYEDGVGFTVSRRITTHDGRFAGVVVLGVRLRFFRDQFSRHELGPGNSVTLLRSDGVVLMRSPFDVRAIGHPIEPTSPFYAFARADPPPFTVPDPIDHAERRYVFQRVGTLPLIVMVAAPVTDRYFSSVELWFLPAMMILWAGALALRRVRLQRDRQRREMAALESRDRVEP